MSDPHSSTSSKPDPVLGLERVFGGPSQAAFGTSVFRRPVSPETGVLEATARDVYRTFCGATWDRFGAEAWLGTWKALGSHEGPVEGGILTWLLGLEDPMDRMSASTMLTAHEDPEAAKSSLAAVFDDASVTSIAIYRIGDGGAMSGLLLAARLDSEEAIFLVFLLD